MFLIGGSPLLQEWPCRAMRGQTFFEGEAKAVEQKRCRWEAIIGWHEDWGDGKCPVMVRDAHAEWSSMVMLCSWQIMLNTYRHERPWLKVWPSPSFTSLKICSSPLCLPNEAGSPKAIAIAIDMWYLLAMLLIVAACEWLFPACSQHATWTSKSMWVWFVQKHLKPNARSTTRQTWQHEEQEHADHHREEVLYRIPS